VRLRADVAILSSVVPGLYSFTSLATHQSFIPFFFGWQTSSETFWAEAYDGFSKSHMLSLFYIRFLDLVPV
jgi:hypothetical protein